MRASEIAQTISERLEADFAPLQAAFGAPNPRKVRWCAVDDLLPEELVLAAFQEIPALGAMRRLKTEQERKYVTAKLDKLQGVLREVILALNDPGVADAVADIMGATALETDERLYNGGVTVMMAGDYMCPHLDNSHNLTNSRRRDVVLLYYLTPFWRPEFGGDLEVWNDDFASSESIRFAPNRLVIMETTDHSWHSVRPILGPMPRVNAISYFYAPQSVRSTPRLTRFTGWPDRPLQRASFELQFQARSLAAKLGARRFVRNPHVADTPSPGAMAAPEKSGSSSAAY